ncbi:DUF3696 domain-containing protein [Streptomyces liangshanensis]|uniref:DUF3696 domain-containing protein n=1 Tax=Streptomyces liangshanensis TaxID=2717324 RepID=A0A6G9GXL3_9ACTN|nr:DUF3696 domain-containing protein [Streptomyces liangshanensis]QIQ02965.1 DUF3696 domain-containing protein [Streptomyces liangshanensis]
MPLERFSLENYRCFRDRQEVELGKITVVMGRNNSGKSAVVRALPLVSIGIRGDSPYPLDLDLVQGAIPSFSDLVHGSSPHGRIHLGVSIGIGGGEVVSAAAEVQNIANQGMQLVSALEISSGAEVVNLSWVPGLDAYSSDKRTYRVDQQERKVGFRGLLPESDDWSDSVGGVRGVSRVIREGLDEVRYLGPFRKSPERSFRSPARALGSVGPQGDRALGMLAADEMFGRGLIGREVNNLLEGILPGWRLEVADVGSGMYIPKLRSLHDTDLVVHIDDVGTGVIQFLPIVIQRAADRVEPPIRPVIEIVEEPELHLHPSAHAAIADLYVDAVQDSQVRFLVETHSENFLLRLRRRVAEQRLGAEDVKIYFVEQVEGSATLRKIEVDALGNLDYWPRGVFAEDFEEVRALADAQANRINDAR